MSLLDAFLKRRKKDDSNDSAAIAKERLQIIVTHERAGLQNKPDYIPAMKQDILAVIRRYVNVSEDHVNISFETHPDVSILELNVTLPDD